MRLLPWLVLACSLHCTVHCRSFTDQEEAGDSVPELPKLSRSAKWALIRASGQDPTSRRRRTKDNRARRLAPWRRTRPLEEGPPRPVSLPVAIPISHCPLAFDAVTRASNGRTYLFSGERVFQTWIEDGLPQKAAFSVREMFAGGPARVTAASTNTRSGVTTLFAGRDSYRFRWNEEYKRFHLARNSPRNLNGNITITPTTAFEWKGHQVLLNGEKFVTYDAYWNVATFEEKTAKYFPELPFDLVGLILDRGPTIFLYTKRNTIQVYDRRKHRPVLEFPLQVNEMAGCY